MDRDQLRVMPPCAACAFACICAISLFYSIRIFILKEIILGSLIVKELLLALLEVYMILKVGGYVISFRSSFTWIGF